MEVLREWVLAAAVLFLSAIARATVSAFLRKAGQTRQWPLLVEVAPSIANLIYIVGLRLFTDVAPISPILRVWLDSGIYVVAVLIVLWIISHGATVALTWYAARSSNSRALQQGFIPILRNLITLFVFIMGAIMVLKRFNYDVMSLLTALGVGSLAVGLAAKDTLSNMISGFTLIIDRNLSPGDRINMGGTVGDVEEIGLRSTRLRTGDGNMLIVPNSELVNTKILNMSLPSREGTATTTIRVPYSVPFGRIKAICLEIIDQIEKTNQNRGKWVNLSHLTDGYQTITIGFWVHEMDDAGAALTEFNEKLLARITREQIEFFMPPAFVGTTGTKP